MMSKMIFSSQLNYTWCTSLAYSFETGEKLGQRPRKLVWPGRLRSPQAAPPGLDSGLYLDSCLQCVPQLRGDQKVQFSKHLSWHCGHKSLSGPDVAQVSDDRLPPSILQSTLCTIAIQRLYVHSQGLYSNSHKFH